MWALLGVAVVGNTLRGSEKFPELREDPGGLRMSGSLMLIFAAAPNLAMMGSSDSVASAGASSVSV